MDYPTFIQVSKFDNALFHFGSLVTEPQLACNSEYQLSEAISCLFTLEQFPVVTCDQKLSKRGFYTITSKWTFGERKITLRPAEAIEALKWADNLSVEYYSGKLRWRY